MTQIANRVVNYMSNGDLSADIVSAAEYMNIPYKHDLWFDRLDFRELEKITGLKQCDYSPEEGYIAFCEACDDWWEDLSLSQKKNIYEDNN
jgi:hypothetical protein